MGQPISARGGRVLTAAREALKSPLFLVIAVLQTVGLVGSVAAIFMKELNFSQIMRLITSVQLPAQFNGYMDILMKLMTKLDNDAVVANLALCVPDLLFCLGLWLLVFASRTRKEKCPAQALLS